MNCLVFHFWKSSLGEIFFVGSFPEKCPHFSFAILPFSEFSIAHHLPVQSVEDLVRQLDPLPRVFWTDSFETNHLGFSGPKAATPGTCGCCHLPTSSGSRTRWGEECIEENRGWAVDACAKWSQKFWIFGLRVGTKVGIFRNILKIFSESKKRSWSIMQSSGHVIIFHQPTNSLKWPGENPHCDLPSFWNN